MRIFCELIEEHVQRTEKTAANSGKRKSAAEGFEALFGFGGFFPDRPPVNEGADDEEQGEGGAGDQPELEIVAEEAGEKADRRGSARAAEIPREREQGEERGAPLFLFHPPQSVRKLSIRKGFRHFFN